MNKQNEYSISENKKEDQTKSEKHALEVATIDGLTWHPRWTKIPKASKLAKFYIMPPLMEVEL